MNKINFNSQMEEIISKLDKSGVKKSLLLHSCCAPCSSSCIERLKENFNLTIYFYNPNLDSEEEYLLRLKEQVRLCELLDIDYLLEDYNNSDFISVAKGYESYFEGGARCERCFNLRLNKTAEKAKEKGFDYFATTLTVSPLKNAQKINQIGLEIEKKVGVNFLPTDFKKKGGYSRSIELSKEYNLYRQNYCGCVYSKERAK